MMIIPALRVPYRGTVDVRRVAAAVFAGTNGARRRHGCRPVAWHLELTNVATRHSEAMVRRNFFDHVDPDGRGPGDRFAATHPEVVAAVGENLARVPIGPDQRLAEDLVERWMESPGHRANLLRPAFTHLGVGIVAAFPYVFATQLFGDVLAHLVSPPPCELSAEPSRVIDLRFRLYGAMAQPDCMIWVKSPVRGAKFQMDDVRVTIGAYPLGTRVAGASCVARFEARSGLGDYPVLLGSHGSSRLISTALRVRA